MNWTQGEHRVSVFQERDLLNYSMTHHAGAEERGTISLHLYNTPELRQIALQFITIFKRVLIGNNSTEHCFLPIFWTTLKRPNPSLLVALFARIRPVGVTGNKEVVEARWGVYNENGVTQEDRLKWLEVEADDHNTRYFLINAPFYRDERDDYCFRFKEEILLGPDGHVQSVTLNGRTICVVKDWVADDGKKIAVFLEANDGRKISNSLNNAIVKYSIKNICNRNALREEGTISLALYDTPKLKEIALLFIIIFKRVLLGSRSAEHCFLPIFWTIHERPSPAQDALIALFARVSPTGVSGNKEVVEAYWGVCEADRGDLFKARQPTRLSWLNVGIGDTYTHNFLTNAPFYRKDMDIYGQHFKEVITSGPDNRIQSVILRCVSALDDTVPLDEDNWAITLTSFQPGFFQDFNIGHAQIVWEGIETGNYFLRCADILNREYPDSRANHARIRIVDRVIPNNKWRVGPTWSRTRALTHGMVDTLSAGLPPGARTGWSSIIPFDRLAAFPIREIPAINREQARHMLDLAANCLSFAVSNMRHAEIYLPEPGTDTPEIQPSNYVSYLWTDYTFPIEGIRIEYRNVGFLARFMARSHIVLSMVIMLKNRFRPRDSSRFTLREATLFTMLPGRRIITHFDV